jgi:protein-tyrosine phosphatase
MERVDLHFHLLPGVDDGPPDLATAVELARAATRDGTGVVTCTPHAAFVDAAEIPARVRELRSALGREGIDLELFAGAELAWDDVAGLDDAALATVSHGPAGRRWVLLEAPLPGTGELADFEAAAAELRGRGFGLLLGHPERSPAVTQAPRAHERMLEAGDRVQVNGSSLTGFHGEGARAAGLALVRDGKATVIASDAHLPVGRVPVLGAAVAVLREHGMAEADAERLVAAAPRALLEQGIEPARRLAA